MKYKVCPFRTIDRGRTFCKIAITERKHTTSEVKPSTCASCHVPSILENYPCAHMDLGVEIDEYMGTATAETYYASCRVKVERIMDLSHCNARECALWASPGPELECTEQSPSTSIG